MLLGSPRGLGRARILEQGRDGLEDQAEDATAGIDPDGDEADGDGFGAVLATGDFDGDGYADLAVAAPSEDLRETNEAGAVAVIYGSPEGPTGDRDQLWHQASRGLDETIESGDLFGTSLATGDLDGDDLDDLVIGVPQETIESARGTFIEAGLVHVLYGSSVGLRSARAQRWSQASPGIADEPEGDREDCSDGDLFGSALAVADVNGDGFGDLAIGARRERREGLEGVPGAVHVLFGSAGGLSADGSQRWWKGSPGVSGDWIFEFGRSLAASDLNGDGFGDLVVGMSGYDRRDKATGAAQILYGSAGGLVGAGTQLIHEDTPGVAGQRTDGDDFGWSLATADFDTDGFADLAVGEPTDDGWDDVQASGVVHMLYGSADGLDLARSQRWDQSSPGVEDEPEAFDEACCIMFFGDGFGASLGTGDFDGDGVQDLAVGVPTEEIDGHRTGAVNVLTGGADGLRGWDFVHPSVSKENAWLRSGWALTAATASRGEANC